MSDLKKGLGACAQDMDIDPERKKAALDRIAQRAQKRSIQYRPGWLEMWKVQLLSISGSAWVLQGLFLLLVPFAESFLRRKAYIRGWEVFPLLSVCAALGAVVLVIELSGHFSFKMAELEQSCYLSLSQLWLMRVCCISGVDVLLFLALGIGRAQHYGFGWFAFSIYVLTPFFLANAALFAFFTLGRDRKRAGQTGIIALSVAFLGAEFFCGWIYEKIWLPVWILLLMAAMLLCAVQVHEIGRKMEGEGLCWN